MPVNFGGFISEFAVIRNDVDAGIVVCKNLSFIRKQAVERSTKASLIVSSLSDGVEQYFRY